MTKFISFEIKIALPSEGMNEKTVREGLATRKRDWLKFGCTESSYEDLVRGQ